MGTSSTKVARSSHVISFFTAARSSRSEKEAGRVSKFSLSHHSTMRIPEDLSTSTPNVKLTSIGHEEMVGTIEEKK